MRGRGQHYLIPLLLCWLAGCAVAPQPAVLTKNVEVLKLLSGDVFGLGSDDLLQPVDVLAVNDEMRAFLARHTIPGSGDQQKVRAILRGILDNGLRLDYDNFKTYTAAETFEAREGNCLSFTNLFVALAREADVMAYFQEVKVPPAWAYRDDVYLYNLHVNARVDLPTGVQVVDFNLDEYEQEYHTRRLTDHEALARYHSNMGVHYLQRDEYQQSFLHLRQALVLRDYTAHFWTNLGTLYNRAGFPDHAEQSYLEAVELDDEPTAMSNLARLYETQGRLALAADYGQRVRLYRARNPYYLFHLAQEAYAEQRYDEARKLLQKAIRKRDDEHYFYHLLGMTFLQEGQPERAAAQFELAAEWANRAEDRDSYNRKLERLAHSRARQAS